MKRVGELWEARNSPTVPSSSPHSPLPLSVQFLRPLLRLAVVYRLEKRHTVPFLTATKILDFCDICIFLVSKSHITLA